MEMKKLIDRYQIAMNTINREISQLLKENIHADITADQFGVLHHIHRHNQVTSTDIANTFGVGKSAVTAQITRLFDKGLIKRERDTKDRRVVYLHVTPKGENHVSDIEEMLHRELGAFLKQFEAAEVNQFIESLEKLACVMADEDTE